MAPAKGSRKTTATTKGRRSSNQPSRPRRLRFHASGNAGEDAGELRFTLVLADGAEEQLRGESIEVTAAGDLLVWGKAPEPDGPPTPLVIMAVAQGEWRACYPMLSPLVGGGGAAVMGIRSKQP
jgi:hypothetical protein